MQSRPRRPPLLLSGGGFFCYQRNVRHRTEGEEDIRIRTVFRFVRGIFRRLAGRCPVCSATDWRARNHGWTLPQPVCGKCGHVA
jgi:hypothetical protein